MGENEILGEISEEHEQDMNFIAHNLKGVMLMPGCGEESLKNHDSIDQMCHTLSGVEYVGLPVSWFVSNLDIASTDIKPGIEKKIDEIDDQWLVSNYDRINAYQIHRNDINDPATVRYGGTMADADVLSYAQALKDAGKKVVFYPLLMVDNENKDWCGLISGKVEQVNGFYNQYQKFVKHYANLLKDIVSIFFIGSGLRNLTSIKGEGHDFPFVNNLNLLVDDVRELLGNQVKVSYAANWDEYHSCKGGYRPMDALWANKNINFVGINYYMPLTNAPLKANGASDISIQDIKKGFTSGEGIDFYRAGDEEILFTHPDAKWKDIKHWHSTKHWGYDPENSTNYQTAWLPKSKPFIFSEFGFPSINNSTNEPNKSGNQLPRGSNGEIDLALQARAIRATIEYAYENNFINLVMCQGFDSRGEGWHLNLEYADGEYYKSGYWIDGKIVKK